MKRHQTIFVLILTFSHSQLTARPPTNIEEALECTFFVTTYGKDGKRHAAGTAFVAEEDGTQWIYTNAHVIEGASRIEIRDSNNQVLGGFGRFACFSTGSGNVTFTSEKTSTRETKIRFGGDGVRLELKNKRDIAFSIQKQASKIKHGLEVVTIGDNGGDRVMEIMEGEITATSTSILLTSCGTDHGSSGGPLIDQATMQVIGLNTWGIPDALKPIDAIWQEHKTTGQSAGATILSAATWTELSAADFLKGSEYQKKLIDATRLLSLIYAMTPTESGFSLNYNDNISADFTFQEAMDRYAWDIMLRPVIDLNKKLARSKNSNIGINNMEIVGTYSKAIKDIRANYKRLSDEFTKKTPPYYRNDLEKFGFYELGGECYEKLAEAEKWFTEKATVGGVMPTGKWIHLPPLSSF